MKPRLLAATLLIALLAGAPAGAQGIWKEVVAKEQGFAISMPGDPDHQKQNVRSPAGPVSAHTYTFSRVGTVYSITAVEYPEGLIQPDAADQTLRYTRDGMVKQMEARILADKEIFLGGNPGREFQCQQKNGLYTRIRIYLVKNRMYEVICATAPENRQGGDVPRFLNSFRLLPEPAAPAGAAGAAGGR